MNYYYKSLPNLSTPLAPLYSLLHKNCHWHWCTDHSEVFATIKELLQSSSLLVHCDDKKPLLLACDTSPYGIGVVLSHYMDDGSEKPITLLSSVLLCFNINLMTLSTRISKR